MSPSALNQTTEVIKVVCSMSLEEMPQDVKALEERIIEKVQESGREFYAAVFGAFQQRWLQERRGDYTAVRWRTIDQLTPFGLIRLPVAGGARAGAASGRLSHFKQSAALTQSHTAAFALGGEAGVGSRHGPELSSGGRRALALAAGAGERVVDLEVRAVSWSAPMLATREAVVA